jgi:hypothetical protein
LAFEDSKAYRYVMACPKLGSSGDFRLADASPKKNEGGKTFTTPREDALGRAGG